ncbi:MAG: class II aldolase/adducin family protein [Dehalobacter sp. 4CP]|nr:class II aldolase/adducin family protein [Dehalobacter sp. 4CP]
MILSEEREIVLITAKKALAEGLVRLSFGNFSVYDPKTGYICITPSGIDYSELYPEDIAVIDIEGNEIAGKHKPSIEKAMHIEIYKSRQDSLAICHTHSTYATAWACTAEELPVLVAELASRTGKSIPKVPYFEPGSDLLAQAAAKALKKSDVALLSNHGIIAVGKTMKLAYANALITEEGAMVAYLASRIGRTIEIE